MTWVAVGVMAAATIAKTVNDSQQAKKQTKLAAATERYSPWTGEHATAPVNPVGNDVMQGAGAMAAAYGNQKTNDAQQAQTANLIKALGQQRQPAAMGQQPQGGYYAGPDQNSPWSNDLMNNQLNGTSVG